MTKRSKQSKKQQRLEHSLPCEEQHPEYQKQCWIKTANHDGQHLTIIKISQAPGWRRVYW